VKKKLKDGFWNRNSWWIIPLLFALGGVLLIVLGITLVRNTF
jgi:hypothetical protein